MLINFHVTTESQSVCHQTYNLSATYDTLCLFYATKSFLSEQIIEEQNPLFLN